MPSFGAFFRNNSTRIAIGAAALAILILVGRWGLGTTAPAPAADTMAETPIDELPALGEPEPTLPAEPTAAPPIVVYISGAVQSPDVYTLPAAARVKDLIVAAGGLAGDADPERLNMAEHIADGQHIHVPRLGEPAAAGEDTASQPAESNAQASATIDLNTASAAELDGLEGIGQVLAQRIIEYRTAQGPFKTVDDLTAVKGISATLLQKIAPRLRAGP